MNNTLIITGTLKTRTALHIGAGKGTTEFDALLRRTAAGEPFIPGSALAGALRALATRLAPRLGSKICALGPTSSKKPCGCMVCHLFGDVNPQEEDTEEKGGRASRLWIYDAVLKTANSTWVRDGVGIDRASGAAARQGAVKFDLEVLPAQAKFDLHIELEDANEQDRCLLAAVLAEWQAGRSTVGGRVARGLGAAALEELQVQAQDLNNAAALMSFLRDEPQAGLKAARKDHQEWLRGWLSEARQSVVPVSDAPNQLDVTRSWLELEFTLQATGPLLVNDPTQAGRAGFDHAPLVEGRPVLPGSSLRGVLRSHAERIARTLATEHAENGDVFRSTCPACNPVARPRDKESLSLECCDALLQRREKANAEFPRDPDREVDAEHELCLACQLFGSPRLGSRLIVEDAPLQTGTEPVYKVQDFLAIDRFTGGGKDGAKFDAAALWRPTFTARLRLENPRDWELGWLALTLRDLAEGWLTVGFGAAKGFGQVWVPGWTATIGFLQIPDFPLRGSTTEEPAMPDAGALLKAALLEPQPLSLFQIAAVAGSVQRPTQEENWRWQISPRGDWQPIIKAWVQAFSTQIEGFTRTAATLPPLQVDSYFDDALIERLYPKASVAWEARHD